jgi:hypothetical protein
MAHLRYLRQCIERGTPAEVDYCLHPVAGNIAVIELTDHPEHFWKIFGGLTNTQFQKLNPLIFYSLQRLNFPIAYLLKLIRKCKGGPSLQFLQWVASAVGVAIARDQASNTPQFPPTIGPLMVQYFRKNNANSSAIAVLESFLQLK